MPCPPVVLILSALLAVVAQAQQRCLPCGTDRPCPPSSRGEGEPCGGPCDLKGQCAPGLACTSSNPLWSRMASYFMATAVAEQEGLCVRQEPLAHPCAGCKSPAKIDDAVLDAARWSVVAVNGARNSSTSLEMVRVVRATQQVVAGVRYVITIEVDDSDCVNDGLQHAEGACQLTGPTQLLEVDVVFAPWREPRYTLLRHELGTNP
ncbi:hypothetical protein T492DRAFT_988650 [Pavlovales sp. CCMP2436]|nr:hypothetical protein T492DRAFT_988650 [Pavlovales sp. CCMP2436]|mmetsp:Transcript_31329/g.78374  ORF Transcript_31329/g.78374 Transcript_31329/m.78374 type:complete len:206 (+) Transcript_31329:82-699(+)